MEHSKWRPSPGTVFGLLALVVAVAGTAFAGPLATTSVLSKGEKKQVRKIAKGQANKRITKRAPGLNVDKVDGQDASGFTPADEVHSPGRVVVNDPTPGASDEAQEVNLFRAGAFTIVVTCSENHGGGDNEQALVYVRGPSGSSFSGPTTFVDTNAPNSPNNLVAGVFTSANAIEGGTVTAVAPSGQSAVSVSASAEVGDPAGDCVFGVTAIGP